MYLDIAIYRLEVESFRGTLFLLSVFIHLGFAVGIPQYFYGTYRIYMNGVCPSASFFFAFSLARFL